MKIKELLNAGFQDYPIIDMHAHMDRCGQFMCPGDPGIDGMIRVMDRIGIDKIAISPNMAINCDIIEGNRRVMRAAEKYPDRVIGLCTVNFNRIDESMRTLEECFSTPYFKGVKLHPNFMDYYVTEEDKMNAVLGFAREHKAFLLSHTDIRQHTWSMHPNSSPADFERYIKKYPDVFFILAHNGIIERGFRETERLVLNYPNVYTDTTGFRFSDRWVADRLAAIGCENKLLFGTDMPFNDAGSAASRIVLSEIPLQAKLKMMGGNALHVLRLDIAK